MTDAQRISIGIVGFGKIARTEHVPAIRNSRQFSLHSIADHAPSGATIRHFGDVESMLAAGDPPEAVAICTPPQARYSIARYALTHGKHVLLEKPPCVTLNEAEDLLGLAAEAGTTLFCAWHSRFASAVRPARDWVASRAVHRIRIVWHEDVRVWHPGQEWIWKQGGCGVFDAGINALSIVTALLPEPLLLRDARLQIPASCATPIAAELTFGNRSGLDMTASFNWLHEGRQTWDIEIEADGGTLLISEGGGRLSIDGQHVPLDANEEYRRVYDQFGTLISEERSEVDLAPFSLVAEALQRGRREAAPALPGSAGSPEAAP